MRRAVCATWMVLAALAGGASAAAPRPARPATGRIAPLPDPADANRMSLPTSPAGHFPLNFHAVDAAAIRPSQITLPDGSYAITIEGRMVVWWQVPDPRNQVMRLVELRADAIVVFPRATDPNGEPWFRRLGAGTQVVGSDLIAGVYVAGDVLLSEGSRDLRADELYVDVEGARALALNASLRSFDASRGVPIYLRAARLRQESRDRFSADDTVLTTSEFHTPQIAMTARRIVVRDTTPSDTEAGTLSDDSYRAELEDVRFKVYDHTVLRLPRLAGTLERPDVPIRGLRVGTDSIWGTSVETEWDLPKVLGLPPAPGTTSRFHLDHYSKRGPAAGYDLDYQREDYFGRSTAYFVHDDGRDILGRHPSRRDLLPPGRERGRFTWRHRQFLPYRWQVTSEVAYLSDRNFLEQYYQGEAQAGKEQETLIHAKRIQDNWGLAFLAKPRINDFMDQLEERPSAEFNWTGQSLWDGRLTFHSSSVVGRLRQRYDDTVATPGPETPYTFFGTRNELDLPLSPGRWRLVPYVAGTYGYDDGEGFRTDRWGGALTPERNVLIGEAGLRATAPSIWRVDPGVSSRLWDLHSLRHVVTPSLLVVGYAEDRAAAKQRDLVSFGLSQRWQTKRGAPSRQRAVDWLRWDLSVTAVDSPDRARGNSNEIQWNAPLTPLIDRFSHTAPPQDRRRGNDVGPNRSYVGTNLTWQVTDTTALMADGYYDVIGGVWRRVSAGVARVCWPDLSAYFGTRYLRDTDNGLGQVGSNVFTFAATYRLDPRYAAVFSNQFDFAYGENIRSDITLVRRYHRLNYGLTFRVDESLDRTSLVFSLWPQGIGEMALGFGRHLGAGLND